MIIFSCQIWLENSTNRKRALAASCSPPQACMYVIAAAAAARRAGEARQRQYVEYRRTLLELSREFNRAWTAEIASANQQEEDPRSARSIMAAKKAQRRYELLVSIPTEIMTQQQTEATDCCAVCLSDFQEGDRVKTLRCTHRFHSRCLRQWFEREHLNCPTCRFECTLDSVGTPPKPDVGLGS